MATRYSDALPTDLRYEPERKRVRARRHGDVLVDSSAALLVWLPNEKLPRWAFPEGDVRVQDLPTDAVSGYDDPDLTGHVTVAWAAVDRWFEEKEEAIGHPRDPFARIDVRRSSRRVEVRAGGETVAVTSRARLLFETGLPVRYYLPPEDVRGELLLASDTRTVCPYKGEASYRSVRAGGELHTDAAWFYPCPLNDAREVRDLICFLQEDVELLVDGERA